MRRLEEVSLGHSAHAHLAVIRSIFLFFPAGDRRKVKKRSGIHTGGLFDWRLPSPSCGCSDCTSRWRRSFDWSPCHKLRQPQILSAITFIMPQKHRTRTIYESSVLMTSTLQIPARLAHFSCCKTVNKNKKRADSESKNTLIDSITCEFILRFIVIFGPPRHEGHAFS
jgi:hypothetical protein